MSLQTVADALDLSRKVAVAGSTTALELRNHRVGLRNQAPQAIEL